MAEYRSRHARPRLDRALVAALACTLRAPAWRARVDDYGGDWRHEDQDARVSARPGALIIWRNGDRRAYIEEPTWEDARDALDALARAGLVYSENPGSAGCATGYGSRV